MDSADNIKEDVRRKYASLAEGFGRTIDSCSTNDVSCFADDYSEVDGYVAEADLGLGCGIPTEIARLKPGDTVLDLGSGAGNDIFIARAIVGEPGKLIGVDMTEEMVEKAKENAIRLGFSNVEFRLGEIESLPVSANSIDVVISNCVLNLIPNKQRVFAEIMRVLKAGGHFSISDIVAEGCLLNNLRHLAESYAGCVAGTISKTEYIDLIKQTGFVNVKVARQKPILVPHEVMREHLTEQEMIEARASDSQLISITVYGEKRTK